MERQSTRHISGFAALAALAAEAASAADLAAGVPAIVHLDAHANIGVNATGTALAAATHAALAALPTTWTASPRPTTLATFTALAALAAARATRARPAALAAPRSALRAL